ncbi:MAG: SH3 domain-containing protein [bacterium]
MFSKRLAGIIGGLGLAATVALAASVTVMSVQVRNAEIRETPSYLGKIVTTMAYGDKVTVQSENGAWMQVSSAGQSGWIHSSALTKKNIVMKSGAGAQTTASSGEMALAGKGFNSKVEAQFKNNHKDIDFSWVDKMEKIKIPPSEIREFAKDGKLTAGGGAK